MLAHTADETATNLTNLAIVDLERGIIEDARPPFSCRSLERSLSAADLNGHPQFSGQDLKIVWSPQLKYVVVKYTDFSNFAVWHKFKFNNLQLPIDLQALNN